MSRLVAFMRKRLSQGRFGYSLCSTQAPCKRQFCRESFKIPTKPDRNMLIILPEHPLSRMSHLVAIRLSSQGAIWVFVLPWTSCFGSYFCFFLRQLLSLALLTRCQVVLTCDGYRALEAGLQKHAQPYRLN